MLPPLDFVPPSIQQLYEGNDECAIDFRLHVRLYNKAFAFTSTGGSGHLDGLVYDGRGPPCYKIHGELYHRLGPLLPGPGQQPVYSQLYIYDHDEAMHYRLQNNPTRKPETMQIIHDALHDSHPFAEVYLHALIP